MTELASRTLVSWPIVVLRRPLTIPQFAVTAVALCLGATLYCQLYCLIAYQPTNRMPMPLAASIAWAIAAVLPWLMGFELAKRRDTWSNSFRARAAGIVILFASAAALSIVLELGLDQLIGVEQTRPLPMQIAAQLPAAAIAGGLLWLGARRDAVDTDREDLACEPLLGLLALGSKIGWIEAAGNYVQVHAPDGVTLHRVTMAELEKTLDPARFRRVHRSAIVNIDAVESRLLVRGVPAIRLTDGTVVKIGSRYRRSLP